MRVPDDIVNDFECVCFHMTDVPYGRGGSPLQNLILRGHRETKITALRMDCGLDTGPVYLKRPLSLDGSALEIYKRAACITYDMIRELVVRQPEPLSQVGETVVFRRRTPEQSELPKAYSNSELYDFIRMLDAETYPRAFLEHGNWRLEFAHARLDDDELQATVRFIAKDGE